MKKCIDCEYFQEQRVSKLLQSQGFCSSQSKSKAINGHCSQFVTNKFVAALNTLLQEHDASLAVEEHGTPYSRCPEIIVRRPGRGNLTLGAYHDYLSCHPLF